MRVLMRRASGAVGLALLTAVLAPAVAAHGFGQRFDLPLPLSFWVVGAGFTILLSFAAVIDFVPQRFLGPDYPRLELPRPPPLRLVGVFLGRTGRVVAVVALLATIVAGLLGDQQPERNLAPTMVWVIWWVGMAFACALLVDLWAIVNPWRTLFALYETGLASLRQSSPRPVLRYPDSLGVWPGVAVMGVFAWCEHVWDAASVPRALAICALAYTGLTLVGMVLFGRERWLRGGEAFSIAFSVLGRFAPLQVADTVAGRPGADLAESSTRVVLRMPSSGLLDVRPAEPSMVVFIVLLLSTVTFDGFIETPAWSTVASFLASTAGLESHNAAGVATIGLVAFPLVFLSAFALCALLMAALSRPRGDVSGAAVSIGTVARHFVVTLVPIAVAYHLAHYLSLLLTSGQRIIPLLSDPLGLGWDLLGTAAYALDPGLIDADTLWYAVVVSILLGHVLSVYLAHVVALQLCPDKRSALWMEAPMVLLMVGYTMVSLWILAQPAYG